MTVPGYPSLRNRRGKWLTMYDPQRYFKVWHPPLFGHGQPEPMSLTLKELNAVYSPIVDTHGARTRRAFEQRTVIGALPAHTSLSAQLLRLIQDTDAQQDLWRPQTLAGHWTKHGQGNDLAALDICAGALRSFARHHGTKGDFLEEFRGQVNGQEDYAQLASSVVQATALEPEAFAFQLRAPNPPDKTGLSFSIIVPTALQRQFGAINPSPVLVAVILAGHDQVTTANGTIHVPKAFPDFGFSTVYPLIGKADDNLSVLGFTIMLTLV